MANAEGGARLTLWSALHGTPYRVKISAFLKDAYHAHELRRKIIADGSGAAGLLVWFPGNRRGNPQNHQAVRSYSFFPENESEARHRHRGRHEPDLRDQVAAWRFRALAIRPLEGRRGRRRAEEARGSQWSSQPDLASAGRYAAGEPASALF